MPPSMNMHKQTGLYVLAAAAFAAIAAPAVEVDGIAAKVDSAAILRSDVVGELRRAGLPADRYDAMLREMVERRLILKAAAASKMTMQDWVVENRIREIITRSFDGDRNRLMEALAKQKTSYPEWRQRMQDDMVVAAMRWQTIDRNVSASPAAMREEYERNPGRYRSAGRASVSVILLKPEDVGKRGEVAEALGKEPFADVARRYSADSHAAEGGAWNDVVPEEVFRPEVCKALSSLGKGGVSDWIDLDGWSFLLRKDAETPPRAKTFAEAYEEIEANVREQVAARMYSQWIDRLKAEAYISVGEGDGK